MASTELAIALSRSRAPVPAPEGIVRVPLTGYVRAAGLLGAILGMFLGGLLFSVPPLTNLAPEIRSAAAPWGMLLGTIPGAALLHWLTVAQSRGRAIVFDAKNVWIEGPDRVPDPLPWTGLRLREGRVPHLVAEDGRSIPFAREALAWNPEQKYLSALVETLPRIPARPLLPTPALVVLALVGLASGSYGVRIRPPFDAADEGGPFWSSARIAWFAAVAVGATLLIGSSFALLLRYAAGADAKLSDAKRADAQEPGPTSPGATSPGAAKPGDEIAAMIRAHRFRPPEIALDEGRRYAYREPELWRAHAHSQRGARIALLVMGGFLLVLMSFMKTSSGSVSPNFGFFMGLAVFALCAVPLLVPTPTRAGWTIRVEGNVAEGKVAIVTKEDGTERRYVWPPTRTRVATELHDWTDELRAGRHRLRIDRRLLAPAEEAAPYGP